MRPPETHLHGPAQRAPGKSQGGAAVRAIDDFQVLPLDAFVPPSAQRFHRRFFRRKTCRVAFVAVGLLFDVGDFARRKDLDEKARTVTVDNQPEALYVFHLDADAQKHRIRDPFPGKLA
jgi:hypothetical protein